LVETKVLELDFEIIKYMEAPALIDLILENNEARSLDDKHDREVVGKALANALEAWTSYRAAIAAFRMSGELTPDEIIEAMAAIESGYANDLTDKDT